MTRTGNVLGKTERDEEARWKAESDARTLKEAEMIRGDKERMKKAMAIMDEEMKAMTKATAGQK